LSPGFSLEAIDLGGQEVSFADVSGIKQAHDASLTANSPEPANVSATLKVAGVQYVALPFDKLPYFAPTQRSAFVQQPSMQRLMERNEPLEIQYSPAFKAAGFSIPTDVHTKLGMFADVIKPPQIDLAINTRAAIRMVSPGFQLKSLSALSGVSGLGSVDLGGALPKIDFKKYFGNLTGGALGKLLGGVSLGDIVKDLPASDIGFGSFGRALPRIVELAKTKELLYEWCVPKERLQKFGPFEPRNGSEDATLCISARLYVGPPEPNKHRLTINVTMANFTLHFFSKDNPFISVGFKKVSTIQIDDHSPSFDVSVDGVKLNGALDFISKMLGPLTGAKRPSPIEIVNSAITYIHTIPMPSVPAGAFSITNLSLLLGIAIPLDGSGVGLEVALAERRNPFLLMVSGLGGGGYLSFRFRFAPGAEALVERVEGAMEFGGRLALDVGVAKGEAYLLAGIYFKVERKDGRNAFTIGGYVRCGGALNVLGLITVTVEFFMGLTYESQGKRLIGEASLTVSIELLFFSVSVRIGVRHCFSLESGGSCSLLDSGPTLASDPWHEYWSAFA
jgi:hypothetical protein